MCKRLFRIWLSESKQMVTCVDYLIDSAGTVYAVASDPPYIRVQINAYAMRATDAIYQTVAMGKVMSGVVLYELDIIMNEGDWGIVYWEDNAFRVHFPCNDVSERLDDIVIEDVLSNYWLALADERFAEFIDTIPNSIRPDK